MKNTHVLAPGNAPETQKTLGEAGLPVEEIHSAASSGEAPTVLYFERSERHLLLMPSNDQID